ncbi:MAG: Acetophenone carboxylase gamma subunit [Alphaproteobacteria bacterium MarineAlpha5_Bin9]|nr:MAG: Acetophenone carboxylase gamma subunit [Alphaproteobacteria bacterium MarineAlpha5_Bin9]|tara:strand:- start:13646 stop:15187 length:1542 start_codon:yes stop_codon:yes gene_type:complete
MQIGVDVGGTNTDGVIMSNGKVLVSDKTVTTPNVGDGVFNVIKSVLDKGKISADKITSVMIGTTHFTNALVERKRLQKIAAIRLCLPASDSLVQMIGWPEDLVQTLNPVKFFAKGGYEVDGREISPLDTDEINKIVDKISKTDVDSIAINSVYSPLNSEMEEKAAEIISKKLPNVKISLSNAIGKVGLIERENATIINAALSKLAEDIVEAFETALKNLNIKAPLYISQNDGTLMRPEKVKSYPVLTFACGPTNSMRGAAFLSGIEESIIVDIGGTTSDIGYIKQGFPRQSAVATDVGGVRTNFRMPDIVSIGLGGGSIVREDGKIIGPDSVGYMLTKKAKVFGGDTLTTTDIAVAKYNLKIGNPELIKDIDKNIVENAKKQITKLLEDSIDKMKTSSQDVPAIFVGGGTIINKENVKGVSELIIPENFSVANAVGAALGQVSGEVDRVFHYDKLGRDKTIEQASIEAKEKAKEAGAIEKSIEIMEINENPLAYLPGRSVRLQIKAIGDLENI